MVQVKVRDEEQIDLVGLDHVDEGEGVHPGEARVDAAVELQKCSTVPLRVSICI